MSRARMSSAGVFLVAATALAVPGAAYAGGAPSKGGTAESPFGALAGSQLSTKQLGTTRGAGVGNISIDSGNVTNTLNDTASSTGTLYGSVQGGAGWGLATNLVSSNQGIVNAVANSGSNVMINQTMSVFVNAQ